ncbi:MAG TPA: helix-turn-helix domain-containing protein [Chthoniobacterales bacterium]|jgi:DNA-binding MarR family transcriptional regulator|nr:helix-turn-helix domain-containing protein [Chthoniobacterales bacterium]
MIADVFESTSGSVNAARSIYLALSEIASDRQSETFDATQADIAHRAGLSVATVKRILPNFQKLGLIRVKRNSINGIETRSTYTLIRGALAHHEPALAHQPKTKRATEEESSEESFEGTARMKNLGDSNTCDSSLAGSSGSKFNPHSGEYEW